MVVSVRAGLAACVGFVSLTAAAAPPQVAGPQTVAPQAVNATADTAPAPASPAVATQAPAYFILQDRAEDPVEAADNGTTAVADVPDADKAQPAAATSDDLGAEQRCLAVAVYYEARGEPLSGQRAVAHVILNRAHSGRFAPTLCGVVRQPGQFSFRGRSFAPPASTDWTRSVAVAREAMDGTGGNPAKGALFFHASYVAPGWDRAEVAQIGHHVFYR